MTNAEILLKQAIEALDAGKLSGKEKEKALVEKMRNWDKKRLRNLSSRDYTMLRNIVQDAQ